MSFDLYFCWQKSEKVDFNAVSAWAIQRGNFKREHDQLWYENPNTGVYFSFDFESEKSLPSENSLIPNGYFDSGLAFNLNFNRPSFFGYEAMPFIEELSSHFGLSALDNQADAGPTLVTEALARTLLDSWLRHNKWAIQTLLENPAFSNPLRMPIASSLYLWRYGMARDDLQRECGEGIFVPTIVPVHRKGANLMGRGFTSTGVPTIVPSSEWVFVVSPDKKGIFRSPAKQELRAISMETFREVVGDCLQPFDWPELDLGIIRAESLAKATQHLQKIEHALDRSELEVTRTDAFVDVLLDDER
jgi:hypothetical protein